MTSNLFISPSGGHNSPFRLSWTETHKKKNTSLHYTHIIYILCCLYTIVIVYFTHMIKRTSMERKG